MKGVWVPSVQVKAIRSRLKTERHLRSGIVFLVLAVFWGLWAGSPVHAAAQGPTPSAGKRPNWDQARYISVDEIKPGMTAHCLTCLSGTEVEQFDLEVISIVRDMSPGHDAILVQGTDERFVHAGVIGGCSGSPVYVNGRMAGALAFGWPFSKDPLYGVTPIAEMLGIGWTTEGPENAKQTWRKTSSSIGNWDFSQPIDFSQITELVNKAPAHAHANRSIHVPLPLLVSGMTAPAVQSMQSVFQPFGLAPLASVGGKATGAAGSETALVPGGTLVIPLVSGDIKMSVLGTVTEIRDDLVFGLGHPFLGTGAIDLPMATGQIHAVVSSLQRSFKIGSELELVGALRADEATGVRGRIGATAKTIPLTLRVIHFSRPQKEIFHCRVVYDEVLTPNLLSATVSGIAEGLGKLPADHTISYSAVIRLQDNQALQFQNLSSGLGFREVIGDSVGSVAMLLTNPYHKIDVKAIELDFEVMPKNSIAHISSIDVSDLAVKAGEDIKVGVVIESYQARKRRIEFKVTVPEMTKAGKYTLSIGGLTDYLQQVRRKAPYRLLARDLPTLMDALDFLLNLKRDQLYCTLDLPASGIAVERAELPDLPASKALVIQDVKRTLRIQPYQPWVEHSRAIASVITNKQGAQITVEE
jgi:hypothetical protein